MNDSKYIEFKQASKGKTPDEALDLAISFIDPEQKLTEDEFTNKIKPYIDKIESRSTKSEFKKAVNDFTKETGELLLFNWLIPGLAKEAYGKHKDYVRRTNGAHLPPLIDEQRDMNELEQNEYSYFKHVDENKNRQLEPSMNSERNTSDLEEAHRIYEEPNSAMRFIPRANEMRATTGNHNVDKLVDETTFPYRQALRENKLLRDLTEIEYHDYVNHYGEAIFDTNEPITVDSIKQHLKDYYSKYNFKSSNEIQEDVNKAFRDAHTNIYDEERDLFDLEELIFGDNPAAHPYNFLTSTEKRDILNRARNNYIKITGQDINVANKNMLSWGAHQAIQKVLDVIAIEPITRVALKSGLSAIYNLLINKQDSGWKKLVNVVMDSGVLPLLAIKELVPRIEPRYLMYAGNYIANFLKKIGVGWLANKIKSISSYLPSWSGLNMVSNNDVYTPVRLAAGIEYSGIKNTLKFLFNSIKNKVSSIVRNKQNESVIKEAEEIINDNYEYEDRKAALKEKMMKHNKRMALKKNMIDYIDKQRSRNELKAKMKAYTSENI